MYWYLDNKHFLSSSLKVHPPLPLVDTQTLLLCAHCISPVEDDEDVCICASSKHVTRGGFDLIRNNYKIKKKIYHNQLCASNDNFFKYFKLWYRLLWFTRCVKLCLKIIGEEVPDNGPIILPFIQPATAGEAQFLSQRRGVDLHPVEEPTCWSSSFNSDTS